MSQPIRQDDFIQSIADAFQFISCYHPLDFIQALGAAYEREQSPAARGCDQHAVGTRKTASKAAITARRGRSIDIS